MEQKPEISRTIMHVDMDAFFASVEQRDFPELRGKPVLVGYDGPRGVVSAASYEARKYGCHSAQAMVVAKRHCPNAIIRPVRGKVYGEVSRKVFVIFGDYSPVIEPLSVDEAFLDMTGSERVLGAAVEVGREIKSRIREELNLVASIGIGPNKFLAKLASDLEKPDGLTVIEEGRIDEVLLPLAITKLWGVGKVTAERFHKIGIKTIGDLRASTLEWLKKYIGNEAERYWALAHGIDDRAVEPGREAKSVSHEHTFEVDVDDVDVVREVLLNQTEKVARRLRKLGVVAGCVSIKIRYGQFKTITRAKTLGRESNLTADLWAAVSEAFGEWSFEPVRLIGVSSDRLSVGEGQGELFEDVGREQQVKIDQVADMITDKFGKTAIKRGGV